MRTLRIVRSTILPALALALAACEAGPGPAGIDRRGPEVVRVNGVDLLVAPTGLTLAGGSATVEIGADGGAIEVGGGRLAVPPGALHGKVAITMEGPLDSMFLYRFGPGGLGFDGGATLSIAVDPGAVGVDDPSRLKIAGASDAGDDWEVIGGTWDEASGAVVWPIEHFSKYGLCVD